MAVAVRVACQPFTVEHFEQWVDECELRLDSGEDWQLEEEATEELDGTPRLTAPLPAVWRKQ